jgi:hypothetical protein
MSIAADEITTPIILPVQARPLKRAFADIDEHASQEPTSDELYGWIEDDEVAAEGLLIDDAPAVDPDDTAASRSTERNTKMTRPFTL